MHEHDSSYEGCKNADDRDKLNAGWCEEEDRHCIYWGGECQVEPQELGLEVENLNL